MSKHTPRKWKYASVFVNNGPNQHHVITGWGQPSIAICANEADARLIEAAPKMLECIREMLSSYGRTVEQAWDDVPLEPWEAMAREIIKRLDSD